MQDDKKICDDCTLFNVKMHVITVDSKKTLKLRIKWHATVRLTLSEEKERRTSLKWKCFMQTAGQLKIWLKSFGVLFSVFPNHPLSYVALFNRLVFFFFLVVVVVRLVTFSLSFFRVFSDVRYFIDPEFVTCIRILKAKCVPWKWKQLDFLSFWFQCKFLLIDALCAPKLMIVYISIVIVLFLSYR